MAKRVAFNPTESPVVIDDKGHSIAGLDRGEVDSTSDVVKQAIDGGRLVLTDDGTKGGNNKSKGDA